MSEFFRKPIVKTLMLKGEKGDKGDAYIITESDKQEIKEALSGDISELKSDIAEISKNSLTVDSEGYICLSYKGE